MSTLKDAAAVVQMLCQYFVHGTFQQCQAEALSPSQGSYALVSAHSRQTAGHGMELKAVDVDAGGQSCLRARPEHASVSSLTSGSHHINANESSVFSGSASSLDTPDTWQSLNGSPDRSSSCSSSSSSSSSADSNSELGSRSGSITASDFQTASHEPSQLQSNESLWNQHQYSHAKPNPAEPRAIPHGPPRNLHEADAILGPSQSPSLSHCEQPAVPSNIIFSTKCTNAVS